MISTLVCLTMTRILTGPRDIAGIFLTFKTTNKGISPYFSHRMIKIFGQ